MRWTWQELRALRERITGRWFAEQGVVLESVTVPARDNKVVIDVVVTEPRAGLEQQLIDHFDAVGKLVVRIAVRPPWAGGHGDVTVTVRDVSGRPVVGVDCGFFALDVNAGLGDYAWTDSNDEGECRLAHIPATTYRVEVWRGLDYQFLASGVVLVPDDGEATTSITVPTT